MLSYRRRWQRFRQFLVRRARTVFGTSGYMPHNPTLKPRSNGAPFHPCYATTCQVSNRKRIEEISRVRIGETGSVPRMSAGWLAPNHRPRPPGSAPQHRRTGSTAGASLVLPLVVHGNLLTRKVTMPADARRRLERRSTFQALAVRRFRAKRLRWDHEHETIRSSYLRQQGFKYYSVDL
jgi:hypothetical protein